MLDLYIAKDAVEKAFFDLKNVEDAKRLNTQNENPSFSALSITFLAFSTTD